MARAAADKHEGQGDKGRPGEVWVVVEHEGEQAQRVSWELIGQAVELAAALGSRPAAVILGAGGPELAPATFAYGARAVYLADHARLNPYTAEPHCQALASLAKKHRPEIILLGATTKGRDLASAVATDLETGLTADCTGLEIDTESGMLRQTRPAFGGNVMATIITPNHRPQMATVRPGVFPLPPALTREGEVITAKPRLSAALASVQRLNFIANPADSASLEGAHIVVAGGRGLKQGKNFALLEELAAELGGVVAASRGAVDAGWISHRRQVGQTGQTVRPIIYIAAGISGAIQHLAGMQEADIIIAINSDPQAPIFEVADYGIVADLFEAIPLLTQEIKRRKQQAGQPPGTGLIQAVSGESS